MYNAYKVCMYIHVERMKEMKKVSGEICVYMLAS